MVKSCDDAIKKPLWIIYKNCIKTAIYPNSQKTSNIIPVCKKGDKQIAKNYRPVSLLPIFGKVFEKILCNPTQENGLLYDNQSGFQYPDLCEYQYFLLFITCMHGTTLHTNMVQRKYNRFVERYYMINKTNTINIKN